MRFLVTSRMEKLFNYSDKFQFGYYFSETSSENKKDKLYWRHWPSAGLVWAWFVGICASGSLPFGDILFPKRSNAIARQTVDGVEPLLCCSRLRRRGLVATPDVKCASNGIAAPEREREVRLRKGVRAEAWGWRRLVQKFTMPMHSLSGPMAAPPTHPTTLQCSAAGERQRRGPLSRSRRRWEVAESPRLTAVLVGPVLEKLVFSRHASSVSWGCPELALAANRKW